MLQFLPAGSATRCDRVARVRGTRVVWQPLSILETIRFWEWCGGDASPAAAGFMSTYNNRQEKLLAHRQPTRDLNTFQNKALSLEYAAPDAVDAHLAQCGTIGYVGFDGNMDTNIAIRTLVYSGNEIRCWAGGGIVADSVESAEYQEMFDKAAECLRCCADTAAKPPDRSQSALPAK